MSIEKRIKRLEAILDARGLDWDHPRVEDDHFAGADKMVAEEPPKKWRILEPGEVVCFSDWVKAKTNPPSDPPNGLGWRPVDASVGTSVCQDDPCIFARPVADEPAKEPKPAWEPKVGDWVRVTRPVDWIEWEHPRWEGCMHQFDGQVGQIECEWEGHFQIRGFAASNEFRYQFHQDWLTPAEPPKAPQPEYREPVLPADAGQPCEFSMTEKDWYPSLLSGFQVHNTPWISSSLGRWNFARIKVDA